MTEAEWLECDDPQTMLHHLHGNVSERKLRLFGCAFVRSIWNLLTDDIFRNAVEVAERYSDGEASNKELTEIGRASGATLERNGINGVSGFPYNAMGCAWSTTRIPVGSAAMYPLWVFNSDADKQMQVKLLRDIFGNPFSPIALARATPEATMLARKAYHDRNFDSLPLLADVLDEAGCPTSGIGDHCRHAGPHVRGCWLVDLLLGKEQVMVQTTWHDEDERHVIEDVQQYGWHIALIGDDPEGPAFAYSIGIRHTLKQPEIIIFGLSSTEAMGNIINVVGEEMRKGTSFEDWMESDQILEGYNCMFRHVDPAFYPDYLGYVMWFHRPDDFAGGTELFSAARLPFHRWHSEKARCCLGNKRQSHHSRSFLRTRPVVKRSSFPPSTPSPP